MTRHHHRLSEKLRLSSLYALRRRLSRAFLRLCKSLASLFPLTKSLGFTFNLSFLSMDDLLAPDDDDTLFDLDCTSRPPPLVQYFPEDDYDDHGPEKLYLVPYRWWKEARGNDENIGGVLYSAGLKEDSEMKIQLGLQREDNPQVEDEKEGFSDRKFAFVQEAMWLRALKWYHDSTAVESAIKPVSLKDDMLDVFPLKIRLSVSLAAKSLVVKIRLMDNALDCYDKARNIFTAQNEPWHIWDFSGQIALFCNNVNISSDSSRLASPEVLLELEVHGLSSCAKDAGMINGYTTEGISCSSSLRLIGGDQIVPCFSRKSSSPDSCNSYMMTSYIGLKGLHNLGNTCFMNSAIQCLVHTPKLVDYFLEDFQKEINCENPLGMKGELALAFGDLLRKIWAPGATPIAPRAFKLKLAKFAPQFSGYNQHDSQEFLSFLLDGLHEDLNRVKQKPYVENKDPENRPDQEVADEYWKNHLSRNDSIIVDLCQGQFRSKLVCPVCKKVSITFDPFMYLTMPLPSTTTLSMTVTVTSGDEPPSPITISVLKYGTLMTLIEALSTACSVGSDETLLVAEVFNSRIIRYLDDPSDSLELIRDEDQIVAYRLAKESETSVLVEFTSERKITLCTLRFGFPLVGRFTGLLNGSDLRKAFLSLVSPLQSQSEDESNAYGNSQSSGPTDVDSEMEDASSAWDTDPDDDPYSSNVFQFFYRESRYSSSLIHLQMHKPLNIPSIEGRLEIVVFWPEKMIEKYNMHLFNSLPEICKRQLFARRPAESVPLYKCLQAFLKEEPLGPDDMWYCPSCEKHQQASKKLDMWRLPEILVIHLKRFSYNEVYKSKLETFVDFPLDELDLSSYVTQSDSHSSYRYSLYSISNHYGGMGGGHYTAFVHHGHGRWFVFDDNRVSPIDREEIKTSAAYVLFYRRVHEA